MTPIINTRFRFYDYFPHVSPMHLRNFFGLTYTDQTTIRSNIQKILMTVRNQLMYYRYMQRLNAHDSNPESFDNQYYQEYKTNVMCAMRNIENWRFIDAMLQRASQGDDPKEKNLDFKVKSALAFNNDELVNQEGESEAKNALISLFNHDMSILSGQEIEYLINTL